MTEDLKLDRNALIGLLLICATVVILVGIIAWAVTQ
jgi:hypothetical protein